VPLEERSKRRLSASRQGPVFSSFLERDALREKRRKSRRNTLVISLLVHGLAVAMLVLYSMWDVDQLIGPSVSVKVYSKSKAPRAAVEMTSTRILPDPTR
jgi:hypothetical protein